VEPLASSAIEPVAGAGRRAPGRFSPAAGPAASGSVRMRADRKSGVLAALNMTFPAFACFRDPALARVVTKSFAGRTFLNVASLSEQSRLSAPNPVLELAEAAGGVTNQ